MDLKVWGKLLTLHRRGYGDVQALRDDSPLLAELQNRPQDGISWIQKVAAVELGGLAPVLIVWGYVCIYRRKKYAGGATRGPRGRGHALGGAPPTLVAASFVPWSRVQVSWIMFGEKITFPKVSFRLDSVWYSVSSKHWNRQKTAILGWASG